MDFDTLLYTNYIRIVGVYDNFSILCLLLYRAKCRKRENKKELASVCYGEITVPQPSRGDTV